MKSLCLFSILLVLNVSLKSQKISIEQLNQNQFLLKSDKKTDIMWNSKPDSWENAIKLSVIQGVDTIQIASIHPIFKFAGKNGKYIYESNREIVLQGGINFRDLGGYYTKDGHQVKWGKIYRSADISKLSDKDILGTP